MYSWDLVIRYLQRIISIDLQMATWDTNKMIQLKLKGPFLQRGTLNPLYTFSFPLQLTRDLQFTKYYRF